MVATHSVKINGKWYKAGEITPAEKPAEKPIETSAEKHYTKKDITFMRVDDLRTLAAEKGIENAEEMTGTALKPLLIERLGL